MTRASVILTLAALSVSACTDSERASRAATWSDQPAVITCWSYGAPIYEGASTGKVEYDEGGRVSFVDAATDRYTVIEGDCRVVYRREGEAAAPLAGAPTPPQATAPQATAPVVEAPAV